jgi:hypothetical protein
VAASEGDVDEMTSLLFIALQYLNEDPATDDNSTQTRAALRDQIRGVLSTQYDIGDTPTSNRIMLEIYSALTAAPDELSVATATRTASDISALVESVAETGFQIDDSLAQMSGVAVISSVSNLLRAAVYVFMK